MEITNQSREFDKREIYLMTKSSDVKSVNKIEDGTILEVEGWLDYEDTNSRGESVSILSIIGTNTEGETEVWAAQSTTFQDSFDDIVGIFGLPVSLKKISGTTKAGRTFVNCTIA